MMTKDEWMMMAKQVLWDISMMPESGPSYHLSKEARDLFYALEQIEDEDRFEPQLMQYNDPYYSG